MKRSLRRKINPLSRDDVFTLCREPMAKAFLAGTHHGKLVKQSEMLKKAYTPLTILDQSFYKRAIFGPNQMNNRKGSNTTFARRWSMLVSRVVDKRMSYLSHLGSDVRPG